MSAFGQLAEARGTLFPWVPILIGAGVGWWFALPWEPGLRAYGLAGMVFSGALILWWRGPELLHPLFVAVLCVALGWLACGLRLSLISAPMLEFRYYGPVTGRIVEIDRSQSDALRVTLDQVWLDRVDPAQLPVKVRIALRGKLSGHSASPGETVMLTAHLSAPDGPVEPGAFDFRRMAFFNQLGAVGYTTGPLMLWQETRPDAVPIDRIRRYLSLAMMKAMPSQAGAFAAGAMTGDRSGITQDTVQDLRDSSLAHLLAISGMNLAFLIAFVFALIRYGVALIPWLALRLNSKKVAAVASFFVAAFYLALSGSNVATERAFIMVAVMLAAVMLDRKALTLRSVAIAGVVLLLWKPESLLEPGFQMSFAATVALISGFRELDRRVVGGRVPRWAMPVFTLFFSSLIGGLATAPYAAAHFNRFAEFGLVANLLTVPVMGAVVMPAGAVAALAAPFGLAALPLWVMERGAAWILFVADWVAGWHGAVTAIPAPGPWVVPLITFAGAWFVLSRGWARAAAAAPCFLALCLWVWQERPAVLISKDGGLVGVLGADGRALSTPQGAGFAAQNWLENDGDLVPQRQAAQRKGFRGGEGERQFETAGIRGTVLKGKKAVAGVARACAEADLVVINQEIPEPPKDCRLFDIGFLQQTGAMALYATPTGLKVRAVSDDRRKWSMIAGGEPIADILPREITLASDQ